MSKTWKHISGALGAMILGSLVTGVVLTTPDFLRDDPSAQESVGNAPGAANAPLRGQNLTAAKDLSTAFRNVAELMRPSVVSINTVQTIQGRRLPQGFEELFGMPRGMPQQREAAGMGSGVIVREDGYILTNNHVVEAADELEVEFSDGTKAEGKIIGTDPQTDLAVIKVDRQNLAAVHLGNSDAIRVGDWVVAIGSPFGLDQTVTAGIISGKNRVRGIVGDGAGFEDFLQTDAAINPGNSGGPLVDLNGDLVGINTAIMSRSGSSAGIGFAIPVSLAGPVLKSIIENGTVRRGFLGASLAPVNQKTIEAYGLKVNSGVMIESVLDGMPAAQAGIKVGDVVTSIDGRAVKTSAQMRNYVASRPPGATLVMEINRDGSDVSLRVDLKERTEEVMAQFGSGEILGAELVPVTPTSAQKYGYQNLESGLIVTGIKDDSDAEQAGLMVGDVIEAAGGLELTSARQLEAVLAEAERQKLPVRVSIRRGNQRMLMVVRQ
ncbi:Do family serine endopeptidase [Roseiconus nitratireducens]|uniref:Do family serine endopeptidase n=1 Tax=Roseiconus nitratireducens TaxID=2605748 RepID=A0A5M6D631_9BACT|nr:Do family serine endopeptidase [Roseiconus nitratireducens]KAA5542206.1 Do family serine endopeptidase [Roseiconus nitratireducens]